ncbi:GNAT family N-acetyltransferase [Kocuria rosea]|uniref:GNAT family N-acetyltransferase n=1 Tax=Kocuria rosea TaxID=1275 RepID=UPI00203E7211|nr:GNAT family N-acetyltransferase [Kocuria rosea]MCM3687230.1 GNAT family N-acetyltransferase [Kocuria rosea]
MDEQPSTAPTAPGTVTGSCSAGGHDYTFAQFGVGPGGLAHNRAAAEWVRAIRQGFHQSEPTEETLEHTLAWMHAEQVRLRGAYPRAVPAAALPTHRPVATFASWEGSLNVGRGRLLPARLISEVTVRPTHSRRGLLRRLMTADLDRARQDGYPVALLTATEATIYGRFGFGAATFNREVQVDATTRLQLKAPTVGSVEMADHEAVRALAPRLFQRFHETSHGSVSRVSYHWREYTGEYAINAQKSDPEVRCAVHYDDAMAPDGYVTYRFEANTSYPLTLTVLDLVGASPDVSIALWEFVTSLDLVDQVRFGRAPVEDPLVWAMVDRAKYRVTAEFDKIWLRVLDPAAALEARPYTPRGRIVLSLVDAMGYADGIWALDTTSGRPVVERVADRPRTPDDAAGRSVPAVELPEGADVAMRADVLGSLYLGAVKASTLAQAGLIVARDDDALRDLQDFMETPTAPYGVTQF